MEKLLFNTLKILFISRYGPQTQHYHPKLGEDEYFVASWGGLFARRLKEKYPELDVDIWKCTPKISKIIEKKVYNINGKLFPYKFPVMKNILTFAMLNKIFKISRNKNIIIHHQAVFDRFPFIKYILPGNVKIVLSHHGGKIPPIKSFKSGILKVISKNVSVITYLTPKVKKYYKKLEFAEKNLHFLPVGADFDFFKPIDKDGARNRLSLDSKKVYALFVGAFYKLKSVDLILQIYNKLKNKYNFEVIFIGGENNKENDLYAEVRDSGCHYRNRIKHDELIYYYNSSDFYIHPAFNPDFGGLDVTWLESLACNKPVLSPQLEYLDFDFSELGISVNKDNVLEKTEYMINNFHKFTKCRDVSQQHLDGKNAIIEQLYKIYTTIN